MNSDKYKMIHVQENNKSSELRDAFGVLRYLVTMSSDEFTLDDKPVLFYTVCVFNCFQRDVPQEIDRKPKAGDCPITDFSVAQAIYTDYVRVYASLLKAETRDYQDIDIYAEKIGYKLTNPPCCSTCKWAHWVQCPHPHPHPHFCEKPQLECHNLENSTEYDFDAARKVEYPQHLIPAPHKMLGYPRDCNIQPKPHHSHILMHPKVDLFGVCDNYQPVCVKNK